MFCQHFASSLPWEEGGSDSKPVADQNSGTAGTDTQTRTLTIDLVERLRNGLKPDRFPDSTDQR